MRRRWVPVHNRHADTGSGVDCNSVVDAAHPLLQNLPAYSERPVCPTRGQCCLVLDLRDGNRRWVRCWGSSPQKSFLAKLSTFLRRRLPQAWRPQSILNQLSQRLPQPRPARRGPTHSWLFVFVLHPALGRLLPEAGWLWVSHVYIGAAWHSSLLVLQYAEPVPPSSLVHALHVHVLQHLSVNEAVQCRCLRPSHSFA